MSNNQQPFTINKSRASAAGLSLESGRELTFLNITVNGGGKSYATQMPQMQMPESERGLVGHQSRNGNGDVRKLRIRSAAHRAKAEAFWSALAERRKQPGNCCRCGKPHDGQTRQCRKCLDYQAKYRGRLPAKTEKLTAGMIVAMVIQMRREMDRMQTRFKQWQKAADYRRNLHYRTNTMRKKYLKTVSPAEAMDYLADTNHAYAEAQAG